ncbi:hypothetical protein [Polaribacter sargassicola]|uniref:hypothetical protein n=1 Tax=Polaribacter sargassicola TaxID=2836891 RepID=UPI001F417E57|nr:hypothetical protein [Polaribacter sp. DS7-9]MCG1035521.1 hypothetical protein [Polaribacter sp. DS7-9]
MCDSVFSKFIEKEVKVKMANSKHAHVRYNVLDYYYRKKAFTFNELLNYVNGVIRELYPGEEISVRTLRDDLKVFRDHEKGFGAPLPEKIRVLKYVKPAFSIAQKPLLEYEHYLITAAQQLLERFNHQKLTENNSTMKQKFNNLQKKL